MDLPSLTFARIPVRKRGEEWQEVTAAKPAGRSRVPSAQFRLALPLMLRMEAWKASLNAMVLIAIQDGSVNGVELQT
jgi:hypothetical protein